MNGIMKLYWGSGDNYVLEVLYRIKAKLLLKKQSLLHLRD